MTGDPDLDLALTKVLDAWAIAGPNPQYHEDTKQYLHRIWPSLAVSLEVLEHVARAKRVY